MLRVDIRQRRDTHDMNTSERIDEISAALVAALGSLTPVSKGNRVDTGSYAYTYADLGAIHEHVRPALAGHGLCVLQEPIQRDGQLGARTRIVHSSGQWIESDGTLLPTSRNAGPQEAGSSYTYARRYDLLPMLGLATEDDDGARAQASKQDETRVDTENERRVRSVLADVKAMSDTQKAEMQKWADGRKMSGHALISNAEWLTVVESKVDEIQDEARRAVAQRVVSQNVTSVEQEGVA